MIHLDWLPTLPCTQCHVFTLMLVLLLARGLRFVSLSCRDSIVLILSNGLTLGVLIAIFLHLVLPWHEDDDSLTVVVDGTALPPVFDEAKVSNKLVINSSAPALCNHLAFIPRTSHPK